MVKSSDTNTEILSDFVHFAITDLSFATGKTRYCTGYVVS